MGKREATMQAKRAGDRARKQPFSADDVRKMAEELEAAAGELGAVATRMKLYGLKEIEVDGAMKLDRGLHLIQEWVALANVGIVAAKRSRP